MKRYATILMITMLSWLSTSDVNAQDTIRIAVKGIYTGSSVILRWAPQDIESWRYGKLNGFSIARKSLRENGTLLSTAAFEGSYVLLKDKVELLPENAWEAMADTSDMAGIAAGSIYGDSLDLLPVEGGGMLQIYNKAQELENRFGFSLFAADQDFNVAIAMGLAFIDTTALRGFEYVYFINSTGGAATVGGFTAVETESAAITSAPSGLKAVVGDKVVVLEWNRDETLFGSFVVERAVGISGTFTKLNTSPLMFASTTGNDDELMSYTDSLVDNSTVYVYRVRGTTPFGSLSTPSDTIHATGNPGPLTFLMSINTVEEVTVGSMTITWVFPNSLEGQIIGFHVYRSDKVAGAFVKLNITAMAPTARTYVDASPLSANYYLVKTQDQNGHEYQTFPFLGQPDDDTAPAQPIMLTGVCNEAGVVTLTWAKNTDADILGYRVFMSNIKEGDYAQVTGTWINDTVYHYQVGTNTLSEEMFFAIKALDLHQNQSIMSDPRTIMRPDVIPPAAPVIKKAVASTTGVYFEWDLSSSADVVSYYLDRKELGMPEWIAVVSFSAISPILSHTDLTASVRKRYEYRLVAVDDAKLKSSSKIIKVKPTDIGLRGAIQNFIGQYTPSLRANKLEWEYINDPDLIGFEVFRAIQDSTRQRSFGFLMVPPDPAAVTTINGSAVLVGNQWHCTYIDSDLNFNLKQLNTFVAFPNPDGNTNTSIPAPGGPLPGQTSTVNNFVIPNPNNLAGQSTTIPTKIYYWVMAKYADGGYSPVAGALLINF